MCFPRFRLLTDRAAAALLDLLVTADPSIPYHLPLSEPGVTQVFCLRLPPKRVQLAILGLGFLRLSQGITDHGRVEREDQKD